MYLTCPNDDDKPLSESTTRILFRMPPDLHERIFDTYSGRLAGLRGTVMTPYIDSLKLRVRIFESSSNL